MKSLRPDLAALQPNSYVVGGLARALRTQIPSFPGRECGTLKMLDAWIHELSCSAQFAIRDYKPCYHAHSECDLCHAPVAVSWTAPRISNMFGPNADSYCTTNGVVDARYADSCLQLPGHVHRAGIAKELSKDFVGICLRRLRQSGGELTTPLYLLQYFVGHSPFA
jgi:hypothetical protein